MRIWPKIKGISFHFYNVKYSRNQIGADYNVENKNNMKKKYTYTRTE